MATVQEYKKSRVVDLRKLAKLRELPTSGDKADLAQRLAAWDNDVAKALARRQTRAAQKEGERAAPKHKITKAEPEPEVEPKRTGMTPEAKAQRQRSWWTKAERLWQGGRTAEAAAFYALARSFAMDGPAVSNAIAEAQVHATLALVEQLERIEHPLREIDVASSSQQSSSTLADVRAEVEELRVALASAQAENRRLRSQLGEDTRDLP